MAEPANQSFRLIIGGDRSNLYEIRDGESLTLGRDPVCSIQLDHPTVSPIHCRLDFAGGVLVATDLNSREGLFFHNRRWKRLEFKGDASFALGTLEIFAMPGPPITSPPAYAGAPGPSALPGHPAPGRFPASPSLHVLRRKRPKAPSLAERLNGFLKRNTLFFAVSLFLHLVIGLLVADVPFITRKVQLVREMFTEVSTSEDLVRFEKETPEPPPEFEEPYVEDPLPPEPFPESNPAEETPETEPQVPMEIAVQGLGSGQPTASGLAGEGVAHLRGMGYSEDFRKYIQNLRDEGMDVAFVIDSTSSMLPFIDQAKRVVNQLISKLAAVVPNLRMALVTYRDQGDAFVTRFLPLTSDRYEILNFLEDCTASGGGDFPEAIYEALHRAASTLYWRPGARKVIILVGDAPFHAEDAAKVERLVRTFCAEENRGVVNAVYVGPDASGPDAEHEAAIRCFRDIVRLSGGEYAEVSDYENIVRYLIHLTFGSQWDKDLARLLASVQMDVKSRIVERRAEEGRKEWLMEGLKQIPVRPLIVQALIEESDSKDLIALTDYLESPQVPMETKWAVVYIVRKKLDIPVRFDPYASSENQHQEILAIREAIATSAGGGN